MAPSGLLLSSATAEVSKEMLRISCKLFVKVYLLFTDAAVIIRKVLNLATQGVQYHILIYPDIIIEVTYFKNILKICF